jgi:hypothetical protein
MTCSEAIVTKLLFIFLAVQKENLTHAPAASNAAKRKRKVVLFFNVNTHPQTPSQEGIFQT